MDSSISRKCFESLGFFGSYAILAMEALKEFDGG